MEPHRHCDLIHAWANGARIQFLNIHCKWEDCGTFPLWDEQTVYRAAPAQYARIYQTKKGELKIVTTYCAKDYNTICLFDFAYWVGPWNEVEPLLIPRKYSEVIHAWAEGNPVQIRTQNSDWSVATTNISWGEDIELKKYDPEYARLYKTETGVACLTCSGPPTNITNPSGFKKWIGDWQEVT